MQLHISGKHIDIGSNFQQRAQARLEDGVSKYLDRVVSADVVVTKEGHQFRVDIHANTGTHSHLTLKSKALAVDAYAAFDQAVDRIEKQLARYKNRLRNHHGVTPTRDAASTLVRQAKKYVLRPEDDRELAEEGAPVVIAEKPTAIETLTVSEAVMKMDLSDLPALMFFNSSNGRVNVVYRRHDGNISWVDPEGVAA